MESNDKKELFQFLISKKEIDEKYENDLKNLEKECSKKIKDLSSHEELISKFLSNEEKQNEKEKEELEKKAGKISEKLKNLNENLNQLRALKERYVKNN